MPETTASSTPDWSEFPVRDLASLLKFDDAAREVSAITAELLAHQNYHLVRSRYCHLSIRMNLEGRQAPAFRTKLSAEPKHGDPVLMLMHRDRLVIDYHWCHASRMAVGGPERDRTSIRDSLKRLDKNVCVK